jgi:hypothetical protein
VYPTDELCGVHPTWPPSPLGVTSDFKNFNKVSIASLVEVWPKGPFAIQKSLLFYSKLSYLSERAYILDIHTAFFFLKGTPIVGCRGIDEPHQSILKKDNSATLCNDRGIGAYGKYSAAYCII